MAAELEKVQGTIAECSEQTRSGLKSVSETLDTAEEQLASLRKTIEALDSFESRWKDVQRKFGEVLSNALSAYEKPCALTEDEKMSVLGGSPDVAGLCKRLKEGQYRKVVVMTGAGVSVSAGIPDFRSPGSGLYATLDLQRFQLPSPQAVFDIGFFRGNPEPFFMLSKELFYARDFKPTVAHHFIKLLADKGMLSRCFTQNIDGLDKKAGLPKSLLVEAHGTFEEATCTNPDCKKKYSTLETKMVKSAALEGRIPTCTACNGGVVKPDIVFFGEELPERYKELVEADFEECDLLVVMGTSLQVQPFSSLIHRVRQTTPRLLINKERVGTFTLESDGGGYRDVAMLEECDVAVRRICKLCDWSRELDVLVKRKPSAKAVSTTAGHGAGTRTTATRTAATRTTATRTPPSATRTAATRTTPTRTPPAATRTTPTRTPPAATRTTPTRTPPPATRTAGSNATPTRTPPPATRTAGSNATPTRRAAGGKTAAARTASSSAGSASVYQTHSHSHSRPSNKN